MIMLLIIILELQCDPWRRPKDTPAIIFGLWGLPTFIRSDQENAPAPAPNDEVRNGGGQGPLPAQWPLPGAFQPPAAVFFLPLNNGMPGMDG